MLNLAIGDRCKFKYGTDDLTYVGYNLSGNGYWHQFELTDKPGVVWSEVTASDLNLLEKIKV